MNLKKIDWDKDEEVLEAVKENGFVLEHAPEKYKKDKEFILIVANKQPWILQFASKKLLKDKEFMLREVKQDGWGALLYASKKLKDDKDVAFEAVKNDGMSLGCVSERLEDDKDIVLVAVKQNGWALAHASPRCQEDDDIVLEAVKEAGWALQHASEKLISKDEQYKYFDFFSDYINLDTLLENTDILDDFKHKLVLTFAQHKTYNEFEEICENKGINIDDEIPNDLEHTFKDQMAEIAATIDLKVENDRRNIIKNANEARLNVGI